MPLLLAFSWQPGQTRFLRGLVDDSGLFIAVRSCHHQDEEMGGATFSFLVVVVTVLLGLARGVCQSSASTEGSLQQAYERLKDETLGGHWPLRAGCSLALAARGGERFKVHVS